MRICVLIPSYLRPADLSRCLAALAAQTEPVEAVLVVARAGDDDTLAIAQSWQARMDLRIVMVNAGGVLQAMTAGLAACTGDILAITDDDAVPRSDWLARIAAHFAADLRLGAVGGRDWVHRNGGVVTGNRKLVGKVLWFGRVIGNHHLGAGPAREVDVLKGVNCAFRTAAVVNAGFETRLRGAGAQAHWEICLCFAVRRAGWRIVYDPLVVVDHYPARRFDRDQRDGFDAQAAADRAFNFRLALSAVSPPWRRATAVCWHNIIGTREAPGFARMLVMLAKRDHHALSRNRAVKILLSGGRE